MKVLMGENEALKVHTDLLADKTVEISIDTCHEWLSIVDAVDLIKILTEAFDL